MKDRNDFEGSRERDRRPSEAVYDQHFSPEVGSVWGADRETHAEGQRGERGGAAAGD